MSGTIAATQVLPEREASRRQFERSASSFGEACFVHDETRARLLDRLDFVHIDPGVVIDLGAAHGAGAAALTRRYPSAQVLAIDASVGMLDAARARAPGCGRVAADAERLPLPDGSVELVFANLLLPWCRLERAFAEASRVLAPAGLFVFSTLGPDTLAEIRRPWARIDEAVHVHGFLDMHDVGDLAVKAGFREPVMDVDRVTVTYPDLGALARDLGACGARNVAHGRRRTLTGPGRWRALERALELQRRDARIPITVELIFGLAWGPGGRADRPERSAEAVVPLDAIRGRSKPHDDRR